ncbi:MAG: transport system permease protein [Symbiobacteriaceae bacterium]|jgi:iron complex transport system permease protein|nr:transport system permease protein [Symbiobacteriaceae bacterium]
MRKAVTLRRGPLSFQINLRVIGVLLGLLAVTLGVMIINMGLGEFPIAPVDVLKTVLGLGTGEYDFIVGTLRLPRNFVAFFVGGGLALSGAILQGLTRNPLAAPDVIGITHGANLGAVAVLILAPTAPLIALPGAAIGGALAAATITYTLAWKGGTAPIRLILVGMGIASALQALTTLLLTHGNVIVVSQAMVWITGSVYGRSWEHLARLLPWLVVAIPAALLLARHANALQLGDDIARGLGARVERNRGLLLAISVILAGAAVATCGAVGFVGLMAPHIARQLVGPSQGGLFPVATVAGGLILVTADMLGRTLFAPIEVPAGVITAAVGAPYFLWLLFRSRNA